MEAAASVETGATPARPRAIRRAITAAVAFLGLTVILAVVVAPEPGAAPVRFGLAVALQFMVAAGSWGTLRLAGWARTAALGWGWLALVLAPLIVPAEAGAERVLAGIVGVALMMKLCDAASFAASGWRPLARSYLTNLPNFTSLSLRGLTREPRPDAAESWRGLGRSLGLLAAVVAALLLARRVAWGGEAFLAEHAVKALVLFLAFVAVMDVLTHATRLGGGRARDVNLAPWLARTPAEFWRRYNRTIGQFLDEHAFRPALRRTRSAGLAVLAAFALSGLLHEYIFTLATGRLLGWQMVFFLTQGAAVAATARLRPTRRLALPATILTLAFILASSVPFFLSIDAIAPVYEPRAWLPAR